MTDWGAPLTDEERDRFIDKIATNVVKRGLETPAIIFLEMHKPVSFFASQGLVVFSPFMAPFVGFDNVQLASRLLDKRENVERLIQRIEELAAPRSDKVSHKESHDAAR